MSKLYRILESATSQSDPPSLESILRLDEEFEAWSASIPPSLKILDVTAAGDEIPLILSLRANMVRILIHRQSMVSILSALSGGHDITSTGTGKEATGSPGGRLRRSVLHQSRQICVSTAEEIVQMVGQRHEQTKDAMGPSWFNLYYRTYCAASFYF